MTMQSGAVRLVVEGFEEFEIEEATPEAMGRRVAARATPKLPPRGRARLVLDPVHREHDQTAIAGRTPGRRLILDDRWIGDRLDRRRRP